MATQQFESPIFEPEHSPDTVEEDQAQETSSQLGKDEPSIAPVEATPRTESTPVETKPAIISNQPPFANPKKRNGQWYQSS
jgi:hypothetical protein